MNKFERACKELFESPVTIVDVGAAGGVGELLSLAGLCEVHAVEPRSEFCNALEAEAKTTPYRVFKTYDKGLARTNGPHTLYVTRVPEASSLYYPNADLVKRWRSDGAFEVVSEVTVDCIRLDNMLASAGVSAVDLIKIDTQGSELDILLSAGEYLAKISVIKCEVEFVSLYKGQPLFDDVVRELSKNGFRYIGLFDGSNLADKMIWGDALFIRKHFDQRDRLIKAAAILIYNGYYEEAKWLLMDHDEPSKTYSILIEAHSVDMHPSARFINFVNNYLKSIGAEIPIFEKSRKFLSKVMRRTKAGRAASRIQ